MKQSGVLFSNNYKTAAKTFLQHATLRDVVRDIRLRAPPAVTVDQSVFNMVDELSASREGAVLVMDNNRAVGLFTSSDLLALLLENRDLKKCIVGKEMSGSVILATPEMTVGEALRIMEGNNVRHLPVVVFIGSELDEDTRVSHILSPTDILRFLTESAGASNKH
jgi:CBS domain-containing protein